MVESQTYRVRQQAKREDGEPVAPTEALAGPLAAGSIPLYGGAPGAGGCGGCTDCCHLPQISVTDEEAERLTELYSSVPNPLGKLVIEVDPAHEGWKSMRGPCAFRQLDGPRGPGGCRIYEHRPAACEIFTCALLLDLRRAQERGALAPRPGRVGG